MTPDVTGVKAAVEAAAAEEKARRLGRMPEAGHEYRRARELAPSEAERRYLSKRLAETRPEEPGVL